MDEDDVYILTGDSQVVFLTEQEKQLNIEMRQKLAIASVPNQHDEEDNAIAPLADRRSRLAWDCGDARRVGTRCQNIQSVALNEFVRISGTALERLGQGQTRLVAHGGAVTLPPE